MGAVDFGAYGVTGIYALLLAAGFAFIIALLKGWIVVKPWHDKVEKSNEKFEAANAVLAETNKTLVETNKTLVEQLERIADELDLRTKLR